MPDSLLFLDTPLPYLAAMYFIAYRHDLGRVARPFHDRPGSKADWYSVCKDLGLTGAEVKAPASPLFGGTRNLLLLAASLSIYAVSVFASFFLPWYCLYALQATVAVPLFVLLIANRLGPFPHRPYQDILPYPRLGTRIRDLSGPSPESDAKPTISAHEGTKP